MIANLTRKQHRQMGADRLEIWLGVIGEPAHDALNDVMDSGNISFSNLVAASERRNADAHLVLAIFGWLPGSPSGGPPFFHVSDRRANNEKVYLLNDAHVAAYAIFEDAMQEKKSNWVPCPYIASEGRDEA